MENDNCLACDLEELTNNPKHYEAEQHTCQIGTGTTSSEGSSAYSFDNYQEDTGTTAIYAEKHTGSPTAINYAILGLIGEGGEIANKWKKFYRDYNTSEYFLDSLKAELGDVLWYASQLATELGIPLGEIAAANIRKLNSRKDRGKIGGSGDNR